MFLRRYQRTKQGKAHTYYALVESIRTDSTLIVRLAGFLLDDSSIPFTSSSRPLRHVPSETSWSASGVNSGSMAFGSSASRASTYRWTIARMAGWSSRGASWADATAYGVARTDVAAKKSRRFMAVLGE